MKYIFLLFMAVCGYHSITYGVHLWKKEHNKLGAFSMIMLAISGTTIPAYFLFIRM